MIKSTASLLGFVIALSTIYYISYWGSFDINIFQYLAASDIIKGVAYPLRYGVLLGVFFGLYVLVTVIVALFKKAKEANSKNFSKIDAKIFRIIVVGIFLIASSFLFIYFKDRVWAGLILSTVVLFFVINIVTFVSTTFNVPGPGLKKEEAVLFERGMAIEVISIFEGPLIVLLVVNALISGQVEANAIKSGKSFDYIAVKDLPPNVLKTTEKHLIFLGSAGDKYFLIDKMGNEHFVIDKSVLQVVESFHFDRDNKDAQAVFDHNIQ